MSKKISQTKLITTIFVLITLSCSFFNKSPGRDETVELARNELTRQWAGSASASSEYDNPDWSAHQATGEPDTLECGDKPTAWASLGDFTQEWLEVRYETPVTPTEINIYESHTPTQVVRVEVVDTQSIYHVVYESEPKMMADCPYTLSIPISDANYKAVGVKITMDQSQLDLPWDEIDAVELVGYADITVADQGQKSEAVEESQPEKAPENIPLLELPIANPVQDASFSLAYSGCDEGQEQGADIEVSVHEDRIDIRFRGTHGKYVLLTLPRNLEDDFSDNLVLFALEGRVPSAAGLYIQSAWWYGERGTVTTHYNTDGTLSGSVDFEGTRKRGCDFSVHTEFKHVVLRK